jgi:hypothetical protein
VGANAKIIFRIDYDAYQRGHTQGDETCEQVGTGPVSVSVVREAARDAFIAAVVTQGVDIRSVTHLGRRPTALQATALQWRDPGCVVIGCNRTTRLETDHTVDWADTHVTQIDHLDRYCHHHHWLKTYQGWTLEPGTGKRHMHPPDNDNRPEDQVDDAELQARLENNIDQAKRRRRRGPPD